MPNRTHFHHNTPIAAIDIGSNSIHMMVARLNRRGNLEVLDTEKLSVRLGQFLTADGNLSVEGCRRALKTMMHMSKIASAYGAVTRAVATHSLREAKNHQTLIDDIFNKTGIKIELIDGVEEARLVFLGMRYALPLESTHCLGMDIGGGSTEIIIARGEKIDFVTSVKLGAVTLSTKHFQRGEPSQAQIKSLHEYINLRLEPLGPVAKKHSFKKAVASSGTAKALAVVHSKIFKKKNLTDENGYILPVKDLKAVMNAMERLKSPKKIRDVLGVDPNRCDIILAGAAVMAEVSRIFRVQEWVISTFGLREGVIVDSSRRVLGQTAGRARDIRWDSIHQVAEQWLVDQEQAKATSDLAVNIFDQIGETLHPHASNGDSWLEDRDLLRASAYLHEAGKFIAQSSYHKHSYYMINHGRLLGFTQDERHLIALLAMHHRKAGPKFDTGEFKDLPKSEFRRVEFLSGILRLAAALSRSRRKFVKGVKLRQSPTPVLKILTVSHEDLGVELQQVEREREHLEKAMGWRFEIDPKKLTLIPIKRVTTKRRATTTKKRSTQKIAERLVLGSRKKVKKIQR